LLWPTQLEGELGLSGSQGASILNFQILSMIAMAGWSVKSLGATLM